MKSFKEYSELMESVNHSMDELDNIVNDDLIDQAEYYNIEYDEIKGQHKVTFHDETGKTLASAMVNDPVDAQVYLEDYFDLDDFDEDEIEDMPDDEAAIGSRYGHDA